VRLYVVFPDRRSAWFPSLIQTAIVGGSAASISEVMVPNSGRAAVEEEKGARGEASKNVSLDFTAAHADVEAVELH